jgi:hypothetical protein
MRFNDSKAAAKTKKVDGEFLTAGCFLIVGDPEDISTWKLPWDFSTDAKTESHLRNALARFSELGETRGVSEADEKKAWDKLVAMCNEHDIEVSDDDKSAFLETKGRLRLEVKEISDAGTFRGVLSPYGNVDDGGDVVDPGAFARTLKEDGPTRPMLWQHKNDEPVGMLTLTDSPAGLLCEGKFLFDDALPAARKAYLLLKNQIVKGLSIGFQSVADEVIDGVRHLKEIKLFEGSIVTFPMNEMALVTAVKERESKEGRTISADTRGKLQKCHKCMKEAHEILSSLLDDESGDGASAGSKAAPAPVTAAGGESKPGSVDSHPAELGLIDEIRSMIPA